MAASTVKQVVCVKWGTRYGAEYVNCIYGMVQRNITPPYRVICFTDDSSGVRDEVVCLPLPELGCPVPVNVPGKWPKVALWNSDLHGVEGVVLYVDLDVIITGNLDDFFSYGAAEDVIMARNRIKPLERLGQSSVFRFEVGRHSYMLEDFRRNPQQIAEQYQFEQRYTTRGVRGGVKFWPGRWVIHFRRDCMGPWPLRYLRPPVLPGGAKVVLFPSKPDPPDVMLGRWSDKYPPLSRWQHIKRCFSRDRVRNPYVDLKRYVMPAKWIEEHWRE